MTRIQCKVSDTQVTIKACGPLVELRNLAKIKDTTETVSQHYSSETAQQIFKKLCSCEDQIM